MYFVCWYYFLIVGKSHDSVSIKLIVPWVEINVLCYSTYWTTLLYRSNYLHCLFHRPLFFSFSLEVVLLSDTVDGHWFERIEGETCGKSGEE